MTNEDYKKLRSEVTDSFALLRVYARATKEGFTDENFNEFFPTWCSMAYEGFPIQISMNLIISMLDEKHKYDN